MYDALTQQQKWGFSYAAQVRNQHNSSRNALLAEGAQLHRVDWTAQELAAERLAEAGNVLWAELLTRKTEAFTQAFLAASAEVQADIQTTLGVQDVLQGE
jgi:hypothetical protein